MEPDEFVRDQVSRAVIERIDAALVEIPLYFDDWEYAIELLLNEGLDLNGRPCNRPGRVGKTWRERAAYRLGQRLDAELRKGLPKPLPTNEEAAFALIKGIAADLKESGQALLAAAERLRNRNDPYGASVTHKAAQRALAAAREISGA